MITFGQKLFKEVESEEAALLVQGYNEIVKQDTKYLSGQLGESGAAQFSDTGVAISDVSGFVDAYPEDTLLFCYHDQHPVGFLNYHIAPIHSESYPLITMRELTVRIGMVYVAPEYRNRRLGVALLKQACDVKLAKFATVSFNTFNKIFIKCLRSVNRWKTLDEYRVYTGWLNNYAKLSILDNCINIKKNKTLSELVSTHINTDFISAVKRLPISAASTTATAYTKRYIDELSLSTKTICLPEHGKYGSVIVEPHGDTRYARLYPLLNEFWLSLSDAGAYLRGIMQRVHELDHNLDRFTIINGRPELAEAYERHQFRCYYKTLWSKL